MYTYTYIHMKYDIITKPTYPGKENQQVLEVYFHQLWF